MTGIGVLVGLVLTLGTMTMAQDAESYADLAGRYRLAEMNGATVAARVVLEIHAEGPWRGEGPCNGFGFVQRAAFPEFQAGPIRGTKRACPELDVENAVLGALRVITRAQVDGDRILLTDGEGQSLLFQPTDD